MLVGSASISSFSIFAPELEAQFEWTRVTSSWGYTLNTVTISVFGLVGEVTKSEKALVSESPATPEQEIPSTSKTLIPASFTVSNLKVSPNQAISGQPVTITCDVTNAGEVGGDCTRVLKINGVAESSKLVTIAGGQSATLTFSVTKDTGSYEIEISGQKAILEVAPAPTQAVSSGIGLWWILIGLGITALAVCIFMSRRGRISEVLGKVIKQLQIKTGRGAS